MKAETVVKIVACSVGILTTVCSTPFFLLTIEEWKMARKVEKLRQDIANMPRKHRDLFNNVSK